MVMTSSVVGAQQRDSDLVTIHGIVVDSSSHPRSSMSAASFYEILTRCAGATERLSSGVTWHASGQASICSASQATVSV
jgi:hypothetical protein